MSGLQNLPLKIALALILVSWLGFITVFLAG
jgi:hypothetical protein